MSPQDESPPTPGNAAAAGGSPPAKPSSLEREFGEIKALAKQAKTLAGAATGALTGLPFAALVADSMFAPGQERIVPLVAGAFAVLTLLLLYYAFRDGTRRRALGWGISLSLAGLALFLAYFVFWTALVREVGGTKQLLGFALTDQARAAVKDGTAESDDPKDLLKSFGYESAGRIWKGRTAALIVLLVTFVLACPLAAGGCFLLMLHNTLADREARSHPTDSSQL